LKANYSENYKQTETVMKNEKQSMTL